MTSTAIVTGAGSGLGAALAKALVARGVEVLLTDIDEPAVRRVAAALGGVPSAHLDVTDAEAVQATIDRVVAEHGRLDYMFNNAGIFIGGEFEEISPEGLDRIIDINIRGVVNGAHAAYRQMIGQGSGHIINTASAGGLMAAGQLTAYCMTKHAVVGLSMALHTEAVAHGIGVTVICPGAIETPMLDKGAVGAFHGRDYFLKGQGIRRPLDADRLATIVLDAVAANKALVVEPVQTRIAWRLARLSPTLILRSGAGFVAKQRRSQQARSGS